MFTVRLSPALESRLTKLSRRTGRPKSYYAKRAIAECLDDQADYLIAISRLGRELPALRRSRDIKRLGLDSCCRRSRPERAREAGEDRTESDSARSAATP